MSSPSKQHMKLLYLMKKVLVIMRILKSIREVLNWIWNLDRVEMNENSIPPFYKVGSMYEYENEYYTFERANCIIWFGEYKNRYIFRNISNGDYFFIIGGNDSTRPLLKQFKRVNDSK